VWAALKALANALAVLLVLPAVACYRLGAFALGTDSAYPGWSQAFALLPGVSGNFLRRAFYRMTLGRCGRGACISFGTVFSHPGARVGCHAYIGLFGCLGEVTLEDDVLIGSHVSITNGKAQHGIDRLDLPVREQPGTWPRVTIGRDSWVGDRAVVMADVGRHCVVGAGAIVTRPVPDYAIVAGVPARVIGRRGRNGSSTLETIPLDAEIRHG
jgi:acetyltransferase-like isoleucine patch superfamily enzyme